MSGNVTQECLGLFTILYSQYLVISAIVSVKQNLDYLNRQIVSAKIFFADTISVK